MSEIEQNKEFKKLVQDVADIRDALLGTPYIKKGLVSRVDSLERDMHKLNVIRWRVGAYAAGVSTIIYAGAILIGKIFF